MINNFKNFLIEKDLVKGGISDNLDAMEIAKKHGASIEKIRAALKQGQKVEMEHTDNAQLAYEIAKDHLYEMPDYYDKLQTIEENFLDEKYEFDPQKFAERLKKREQQNIQRYRAAQIRKDNYAISLYELRMKIDKMDFEKLKLKTAINDLKKKNNKI